MQKHILTFSFLLVLTLLFFYPKPSNLLELENIKLQSHQIEKTKSESSKTDQNVVSGEEEDKAVQPEIRGIPHRPMP